MKTDKYILAHKDTDVALISIVLNQNGFSHKITSTYLGLPLLGDNFFIFKKGCIDWYCEKKIWNNLVEAIFRKIKNEKNFSQKILYKSYEIGEKLKKACYEALEHREKLLDECQWRKIISLYDQLLGLGVVAPASDIQHFRLTRTMEKIIGEKIEKYKLLKPIGDYFLVLSKHTQELYNTRSEKELLNLANKFFKEKKVRTLILKRDSQTIKESLIKNWPHLYQRVLEYLGKYCWVKFGHLGPEMKFSDVIEKIKELWRSETKVNLKKKNASLQRLRTLQKKYERELRLSNSEKQIFKTARDFNENKNYRAEMMFLTHFTLHRALHLLAKEVGYSQKELLCLTHLDFLNLLKKKAVINKFILRQRYKLCVSHIKKYNKINIYTGKKARVFIKKWIPREKIKKEKIIKGSTASLGKAKGIVKIINSANDIKKMEKGNILVAVQTTPQLLPAMKKAAAFVTDIGGITSHAAIVARELKVPCIIGTWIATKILKDGDLVEVDANKGMVKILKKDNKYA